MPDKRRCALDISKQPSEQRLPDMVRSTLALIALRRVLRACAAGAKDMALSAGLTGSQFLALQVLGAGGPDTVEQLARKIGLTRASTVAIANKLELRGLVVRGQSDVDGKKAFISLSHAGHIFLMGSPQLHQAVFLQNFSAIPVWERSIIIMALERTAQLLSLPQHAIIPEGEEDETESEVPIASRN